MPRVRSISLALTLLASLAGTWTLHAQTEAGPDPSQVQGGSGEVDPNAPQPSTDPPTPAPSDAQAQPAPSQAIPTSPIQAPSTGTTPPQPEGEAMPEQMRSPRGSVELFLSEADAVIVQREAQPEILLKYLPQKLREAFDKAGVRDARRLAQVLIELQLRDSTSLRLWELKYNEPGALVDWKVSVASVPGEVVQDRSIPLVKGPNGYWRFTEEAVANAARLHALLFPNEYLLRSVFEDLGLTALVDREVLGIGLYQWVSLSALIVMAWLLDLLVALGFLWVIRRYIKKDEDARTPGDSPNLVRKASKPFGLAAGGALVYFLLPLINLPTTAEGILRVAAQAVTLFALFLTISRGIDLVSEYFQRRAIRTSTKFDDLLVPLIRKSAKTVLFVFALLTVAESLSLPVTSLVAGLGIAGAAIAFASKDTVENFFGSVAVILDRPFNAGDYVAIDGIEGSVEHLGFRSTRIRTFYNSLVTIPNALLVRAKVDNYGMRKYRRYKTTLQIKYSTPPDRIEAFVEGIRELVRTSPDTRKDYIEIHFRDFGAHSLDILVWIFFRVPDWPAENVARHSFNMEVLRLAKRLGVEFAFPTQTLELKRAEHGHEYDPPVDAETAHSMGIEAAKSVRSHKVLD
ncbi:MAG: hypothetical protein Tsb0013_12700 [Phycisphaerales bacterium]